MSKGGGGGGVQESTVTQTNLPEYARPYFEDMLKRSVYESTRPYEAFPGQRIADFTPAERAGMAGFQEMAGMGSPQQIKTATDIATQVGYQDIGSGMDIARTFSPEMQRSDYDASRIGSDYQAGYLGPGYQAGQRGVGYRAGSFDPGYQAGELGQGYQAAGLESGYQAGSFDPGYEASVQRSGYRAGMVDQGPGFEAGTVADPETLERYMNPYQQLVTDIEKREARKQSEIQGSAIEQQAAQAGGLGGYREAIMQAEREKNLSEQLQDIQSRGGQAAFAQAQKAFEADRAARLQEGKFGLEASQQLEQARQQQERFRQSSFQAGEQAKQKAAELGLSAEQQEEAARQAQEKFRQDAFSKTEAGRALEQKLDQASFEAGERAKQEAARLGLSAQQQEDAAKRAQETFRQQQFQQNEQLRLAQAKEERAAFEARERARQEAARLGLSGQEIQERALQAENDARMRARAENAQLEETRARLGLAGLGADQTGMAQRLDAAGLLGRLGTDEQRMAIERLRNLQASGEIERNLTQRGLDMGYQDFLRQQAYPREQLAFFSSLLQGLPIQPGSQTTTFGGPSQTERLLGAGIGGVGLYNAMR
tara:strand:+ start:113 stop:1900 length:1788 start_codon:yes stop_codon:yes gene_type:complete